MNGYPIFVQQCKDEFKKRYPEEQPPIELAVKCVERWKIMSDREKKWFNHLAMLQSPSPTKSETTPKRQRKTKRPKDPNAPKRALSGFFWFSNEHRGKIKDANPDFGVGDIAKELGKMWAECDEVTKSKYEGMAEKDRIRYDKEKTAYQLKQKEDGQHNDDYDEDAD
eukprot:TRINITY_DN3981_c0_g1_i1.p1 TRINITY_DN3981_c0_g1~~TRINITY_DN3981_c0_g1_i1.p1  ORF type:complete len:167 (-),score=59.83 TRINITY_DN3981_c0_g1_i1:500-1000(-)